MYKLNRCIIRTPILYLKMVAMKRTSGSDYQPEVNIDEFKSLCKNHPTRGLNLSQTKCVLQVSCYGVWLFVCLSVYSFVCVCVCVSLYLYKCLHIYFQSSWASCFCQLNTITRRLKRNVQRYVITLCVTTKIWHPNIRHLQVCLIPTLKTLSLLELAND